MGIQYANNTKDKPLMKMTSKWHTKTQQMVYVARQQWLVNNGLQYYRRAIDTGNTVKQPQCVKKKKKKKRCLWCQHVFVVNTKTTIHQNNPMSCIHEKACWPQHAEQKEMHNKSFSHT